MWRVYLQACQRGAVGLGGGFDPVRYWARVTLDDIKHWRGQLAAARTETEWPRL